MKKVLSIILSLIMLFSITSVSAVSVSAAEFVKQVIDEDYWYNVYSDNTAEITFYGGTEDIIFIPSSFNEYKVTSIGEEAFVGNEATEIVIPSEVVSIKTRAFAYCYDLEYIEIPDAVTTLGSYVFEECYSLSELTLSENVTSIGKKICGSDTKVITKCGTYAQKYAQEKLSNYKIIEHTNMSSGYRTIKKTEALSIKSKYCKTCENNVGSTIKEGLSSSVKKVELTIGKNKVLKIKTYPSGKKVSYSTSNRKIATVSSGGKVKGIAPGSAKITAKVKVDGKTYKITVTAKVKKHKITTTSAKIYIKRSKKLNVSGGTGKIIWKSSNDSVATVSSSGKVYGVKPGSCTIYAQRNGYTAKCNIKVKKPSLSETSIKVYNSRKTTLSMYGGSGKITWSSSNNSVATVNSNGKVTGKKAGTCYIYAERNGYKIKCKVKVPSKYKGTSIPDLGAVLGLKVYEKTHEDDIYQYSYTVPKSVSSSELRAMLEKYQDKLYDYGFEDYYPSVDSDALWYTDGDYFVLWNFAGGKFIITYSRW